MSERVLSAEEVAAMVERRLREALTHVASDEAWEAEGPTFRVVWGFDRSDDFDTYEEAERYLYNIRGSALRDPFAAPKLFAIAPSGERTLILERLEDPA